VIVSCLWIWRRVMVQCPLVFLPVANSNAKSLFCCHLPELCVCTVQRVICRHRRRAPPSPPTLCPDRPTPAIAIGDVELARISLGEVLPAHQVPWEGSFWSSLHCICHLKLPYRLPKGNACGFCRAHATPLWMV
jgi:hypothetical protein